MKKLLSGLRGRKTGTDNNIPLTTETRINVRRLSKRHSVHRRPQSAPRILDEYPTPPEALAPSNANNLPPLPKGLTLLDSKGYSLGNHQLLGDLDFGAFELPRERVLPSVRHSAYGLDQIRMDQLQRDLAQMDHMQIENTQIGQTPPDEAYIESRLSRERDAKLQSETQINAAVDTSENQEIPASQELPAFRKFKADIFHC
jgi:hypothetical protein